MGTEIDSEETKPSTAEGERPRQADGLIFVAGELVQDPIPDTRAASDRTVSSEDGGSRIDRHTRIILDNLKAILAKEGSDLGHVVKAQVFMKDCGLFGRFDAVWREYFATPPPRTVVQVGPRGLLGPGVVVQVDVIAAVSEAPLQPSSIRGTGGSSVSPADAACATFGDWLFLAGQSATDSGTGEVVARAQVDPKLPFSSSGIELQVEHILGTIGAILEDAGSGPDHVVKAQVFLTDLNDFNGFHQVWLRFFESPPPSTTVQIGGLSTPGALCEIELVAVREGGSATPRFVTAESGPKPLKHAQGAVAGRLAFPAGHVATDFKNGVALEARVDPNFPFYGSNIERQTAYTLEYLAGVLEASGSSLDQVVKGQIFMTDLRNYYGFDKVWRQYFATPPPKTTVEVAGAGLLTPGTLVEIDLIASID